MTGAPVIATGTVSTMAILAKIISSLLVSQGYTLAVLDTAANIGGLTIAQINNLSARGVLLLQASDTSVALMASDAALLEAANMTVTAPSGSIVTVTDTRANLNAMSATTIAGLPALGVSGIVSTTGPVTISVAQALALEGANLEITGPNGASVSVTLSDSASNLAGLTPSQIAALPATGVSAIAVSNAANLVLSVAQATALETSGASLTLQSGDSVIVSDSAANIQSLTVGQIAGLSALDVTQLSATDTTVLLTVAKAQALEAAGIPVSAPSGQTDLLSDTAAHLGGLTVSQINGLTAIGVTGVAVSSAANLTLTVAQAQALGANNLDVTPLTGHTVTISDTAADIAALSAAQLAGFPAIGVTGLVSTDANISYTPDQTAAILSSGLNVSASGSFTVTENFANGNYSVYRGGQLIQQKSVNLDGSYDVANFGVTGLGYSSYEDIYNSAGTLVAEARDMTNGSGNLILDANGLTITSASGSESVTTGSDTFAINPHSVETVTATNMQSETFVYGPGFGQDTTDRLPRNQRQPRSPAIQRFDVRLLHNITDRRCAGPSEQLCVGNDQHPHLSPGPPGRYAHHQQSLRRQLPKQPPRLQVHLTANDVRGQGRRCGATRSGRSLVRPFVVPEPDIDRRDDEQGQRRRPAETGTLRTRPAPGAGTAPSLACWAMTL